MTGTVGKAGRVNDVHVEDEEALEGLEHKTDNSCFTSEKDDSSCCGKSRLYGGGGGNDRCSKTHIKMTTITQRRDDIA